MKTKSKGKSHTAKYRSMRFPRLQAMNRVFQKFLNHLVRRHGREIRCRTLFGQHEKKPPFIITTMGGSEVYEVLMIDKDWQA